MLNLFNSGRVLAASFLLLGFFCLVAQGDVIILKDGYTLYGIKTVKERKPLIDDVTGDVFITDMPSGMTAVDDGPRWVVFPNSPLQVADVSENNKFKDHVSFTRERTRGDVKLPSTAINPRVLKPWDPKEWNRVLEFMDVDPRLKHTVKQHISVITPHYVRLGSVTHKLTSYFLTKEFRPEALRPLLMNHPTLVEMPGKPEIAKRDRLVRFWIQAGWLDEAEKDLAQILIDLPDQKEYCDRLRSEINAIRAQEKLIEIERARDSGRHDWAIEALAKFPMEDVPRAVGVKLTGLQADYELRRSRFALARRFLQELPRSVNAANQFLIDAAATVLAEVHLDTLSRLEVFVTLADRAEKDAKEGRRPAHGPEELLSAAITGWHLGKVAAEPRVATAYRCWMTRQMALAYLRNTSRDGRLGDLQTYLESPNAMQYDELEKLVSLLPPPDAPASPPRQAVRQQMPPSVFQPEGMPFVIRLPDEYQTGRSYPLLLAFPDSSLDPEDEQAPERLLELFRGIPNEHGYILAIPRWWNPRDGKYRYSAEEHSEVLGLLRRLRREYQVDSDRIFLWGNGEGASLALDLGGAHPDLFAGVVPVNPSVYQPLYIPAEYWVNYHQLPVYLIMGDKFGPSVNAIRMLSERWMPRGYPSLVVSYKGRGAEWFPEELPFAFDWMGRKRRADPGKMVGPPAYGRTNGAGFSSVRATDNRFHWLSSESLKPSRLMNPVLGSRATVPIKFHARIVEGNGIEAKAFGMNSLTVWFARGMLDYTKPVRLKVNDAKPVMETITPQPAVLMEDLFERGDRQRPYFYRVDLKVPN